MEKLFEKLFGKKLLLLLLLSLIWYYLVLLDISLYFFSLMFVVCGDSFILFSSIVSDFIIMCFITLPWKLFFFLFTISLSNCP